MKNRLLAQTLFILQALLLLAPHGKVLSETHSKLIAHKLYLEEEASYDYTFAISHDIEGYLWFATDGGLKRYDGYRLTSYTFDPDDPESVSSNLVSTLLIQQDGTLWTGANELNRFNSTKETFTRFDIFDNKSIWALAEDDNGLIWIGGEGSGLRGFNPQTEQLEHIHFSELQPEGNARFITALAKDPNKNEIWVGSSAGLYRFNADNYAHTFFPIPGNLDTGTDGIKDVLVSSIGEIWVATHQGVVRLNPQNGSYKQYQHDHNNPHSLSTNAIWSLNEDSKGQIWLGTDKEGVSKYLYDSDSFQHLGSSTTDDRAIPPGSINDIIEGQNGNIWITVSNYGVKRITEGLEKFEAFKNNEDDPNSMAFNNILDLHEDREGYIWVGTDGGGLDRFDRKTKTFKHYTHDPENPNSLSSNSVISLAEDAQGILWVGTWDGGVNRFNPKTGQFSHIKRDPNKEKGQTLDNNNIFRIQIDHEGWLWFSVWRRGLQRYNPVDGTFETYFPGSIGSESGVINSSVQDIEFTPDNYMYAGGHFGLERFDPKTKTFETIHIPNMGQVYDLLYDENNILWIATTQNFIRYDTKTKNTDYYTTQNGLIDNFVSGIEKDHEGFFWLGTRSGLSRFDPGTKTFKNFDKRDGLAGSQINRFSHLTTKDGHMFFGGAEGLNYFNPAVLPKNTNIPNVVLTGFELYQQPVKIGKHAFLQNHISKTKMLTLDHNQRDLTFEFTALDFISPAKNRFKYRLHGLEEQWTEVDSTRRRARYTNLDPGVYRFEVIASNNEGVWNNKGAAIDLTITSPWWLTWWARLLTVILIICLIYAFIFWRIQVNRFREKALEGLVKGKTRELEKANENVLRLNTSLEKRVEQRTKELLVEVEERKIAENKLFHMAFHDALTGLPNRPWLLENLERLIEKSHNLHNFQFALMFLDGDRFKQINDTHGHLLGDRILVAAGRRLENLLPKGFHAIRLGGDEFTVLVEQAVSAEQVISIGQLIVDEFDRPFIVDQNTLYFKVSIGMVLCGNHYQRPEQILRDADIAMYKSKELGRGMYQLFDEKMRDHTIELLELETDLHQAVERNEFSLVYQPIIDIKNGELVGYEALLRWQHPTKGNIPPDKFIPIAEETGLIVPIGLWVLKNACQQTSSWIEELNFTIPPTIAVNISAVQLNQPDIILKIDEILDETGLESRLLKLEITESVLMENKDTVNPLLDELRFRGIELVIDDFGTGYSSLSYLDQLPVQILKIDRSFVDGMLKPNENKTGASEIVQATISLAHNLRMQVVAEGIETQEQFQTLQEYGCDFGQGFLIEKPLSPGDAWNYMRQLMPEEISGRKAESKTVRPIYKDY